VIADLPPDLRKADIELVVQVSGPPGGHPQHFDSKKDQIKAAVGGIIRGPVSIPPATCELPLNGLSRDKFDLIIFQSYIEYGKDDGGGERHLSERKPDRAAALAKEYLDEFETLPEVASQLSDEEEHRQALAKRVAPILNQYLNKFSHDTLEQKQGVSRFVNLFLERLGLAIRCPRTGKASRLQAAYSRNRSDSRYQLVNNSQDGRPKPTVSSSSIFGLFDEPRVEHPAAPLVLMPEDWNRSANVQGMTWTQLTTQSRQPRPRA
jgi:hypothetical protein